MNSSLASTRYFWRKKMGLPDGVAKDERDWLECVHERDDAEALIDVVAKNMAINVAVIASDLTEVLIGRAAQLRGLRPDLVNAVRSVGNKTCREGHE